MSGCDICLRAEELSAIKSRLETLEAEAQRNQNSHKEFFPRFEQLGEARARTDAQYVSILSKLEKLERLVDELKTRPAKRWDAIVSSALQWLVTAALAAVAFFG